MSERTQIVQRKPVPAFYNGLQVPYIIADCKLLSHGAKLLYAALVECEHPDGSTRQRIPEEVMDILGIDKDEYAALVHELVAAEFIDRDTESKVSPIQFRFLDHDWFYETEEESNAREDRTAALCAKQQKAAKALR